MKAAVIGALILAALPAVGCLGSETVRCSWGVICPAGMACDEVHEQCVFPAQLTACNDLQEGDECSFPGAPAVLFLCREGVCVPALDCGDGVRVDPEDCDGEDLGNTTCLDLGFYGGTLACQADCSDFDTSGCAGRCGNGVIEVQESCDGTNLAGRTCTDLGFTGGTLGCLPDCSDYDTGFCQWCGDGFIQDPETCDGTNVAGRTCTELGFYGGTLACLPDCTDYEISDCRRCGDGVIEGPETCDGTDLAGQTCTGLGFYGGTLGCLPDCSDYDTNSCQGWCGDGTCEPVNGETLVTCPQDCWGLTTISAGGAHGCTADNDGAAWCWGDNAFGQLGDGCTADATAPVQVTGLSGVVDISAGEEHSCAVDGNGLAWCWGHGHSGRLGSGSSADASAPVQVTGLTGVEAVSAGRRAHSCAVDNGGLGWCWGRGGNGRLGNDSDADTSSPVQVVNLSGAVIVSAGGWHSCAMDTNSAAWCWGRGADGRLGNGSIADQLTPVQLSSPQ